MNLESSTYKELSLLNSNHFIWLVAIVLSLLTHAILFFQKNNQLNAVPAMVIQETITHVRFANISPPPITIVESEIKQPLPEPTIIPPKTQPEIQQKIEPVQKPVPVTKSKTVKKKTPSKPKPKKKVTKAKITKVKVPIKKKVPVKKIPAKAQPTTFNSNPQLNKKIKTSPILSEADKRLIEQTRKNYQSLLLRHIEAHKHYPRVARKRKIEGKIIVSFTLLSNGSIKDLMVIGKKSILTKATNNAISNSLPMPMPPKDLDFPLKIKFVMNYFLK